jgi:cell division protein FtsQ
MAKKKKSKAKQRPSRKQSLFQKSVSIGKMLIIPVLVIWLIAWLWLGGIFTKTTMMARDGFINQTAEWGLVVKDIIIEGRHYTDIQELHAAIPVQQGNPVLSIDVEAIQNNIQRLKWVEDVTVSRGLKGIVTIKLTERVPFVIWNRPGRRPALIDMNGEIIEGENIEDYGTLLFVSGIDAPSHTHALIRNLKAQPVIAERVKAAEWVGDRRWDIILTNATRIHLPANDIGLALARLAKLHKDKDMLNRDFMSIDLRMDDRVIIETERGMTQDAFDLSEKQKSLTL